MLNNFRINPNPKQDAETAPPRLQEEPWLISDQDLERNKSKVSYWGEKKILDERYLTVLCECRPKSSLWVLVSASDSPQ